VRTLAGVPSGAIAFTNLHGKSSEPSTAMTLEAVVNTYDDGEGGTYNVMDVFGYHTGSPTTYNGGSMTDTGIGGVTTTSMNLGGGQVDWTTSSSNASVLSTYKGIRLTHQTGNYGPYFYPFAFKNSSTSTVVYWYTGGSLTHVPSTTDGYTINGSMVLKSSDSVVSPLLGSYDGYTYFRYGNSSATCTLYVRADGSYDARDETNAVIAHQFPSNGYWWSGGSTSGIGNNYWVKFTVHSTANVQAGQTYTASTGLLQLSSDRSVTITAPTSVTSGSVGYRIEIFSDSGGTNRVSITRLNIGVYRTS
jgi:hypothetical protein